jgi:hypothetical protein
VVRKTNRAQRPPTTLSIRRWDAASESARYDGPAEARIATSAQPVPEVLVTSTKVQLGDGDDGRKSEMLGVTIQIRVGGTRIPAALFDWIRSLAHEI